MAIDPNKPLQPKADLRTQDLGDELMFYDREGDLIHIINGSGRVLWNHLDGSHNAYDLTDLLEHLYQVESAQAKSDVLDFLNQLARLNLIEPTEPS